MGRPRLVDAAANKELERVEQNLSAITEPVKALDPSKIVTQESAPQTQMSKKEEVTYDAPVLKPIRSINSREPFNEKYREDWKKGWELVKVIVENREIMGECPEPWSKSFAGDPAHQWRVPVNKPVYMPRHLAVQLSKCKYQIFRMEDKQMTNSDGMGTYYGSMVVDSTKDRISIRSCGSSSHASGF